MSKIPIRSWLSISGVVSLLPGLLFAQGSLTPPGPPAAQYKTLTQIEPRTDVQKLSGDPSAVYIINASGSYYLTGNITGQPGKVGIAIDASDVTLDLNGFTLFGNDTGTRAIELRNASNVQVKNGYIRSWGAEGIASSGAAFSVRLEDLVLNFTAGSGIVLTGNDHSVRRCKVRFAGGNGIDIGSTSESGTVESCDVEGASGSSATTYGINAPIVRDSQVFSISNSGGGVVRGIFASVIINCRALAVSNQSLVFGLSATQNVIDSTAFEITTTLGGAIGIEGANVSGCSAGNIGTSGSPSQVIGIQAKNVSQSGVVNIGTAGSGSVYGILASAVHASTANTVGSASASPVVGINGQTVSDSAALNIGVAGGSTTIGIGGGGTVTGCRVQTITSAVAPTGIQAGVVAQSNVNDINQSNSGIGNATGIDADRVTDCNVSFVLGSSTSRSIGINTDQNVSNSSVSVISNSQGSTAGIVATTPGGRVQNCSVGGSPAFGIIVTAGQAIGNTVNGMTNTAISISEGSTADGNNVTNCPTGITAFTNSLTIRNNFRLCANPINIDATSKAGSLVNTAGAIASTNPWVNFRD